MYRTPPFEALASFLITSTKAWYKIHQQSPRLTSTSLHILENYSYLQQKHFFSPSMLRYFSWNGIETEATTLSGIELVPEISPSDLRPPCPSFALPPLRSDLMIESIWFRPSIRG